MHDAVEDLPQGAVVDGGLDEVGLENDVVYKVAVH